MTVIVFDFSVCGSEIIHRESKMCDYRADESFRRRSSRLHKAIAIRIIMEESESLEDEESGDPGQSADVPGLSSDPEPPPSSDGDLLDH